MKRTILSLAALLAVGVASAQSYPKQPDPSAVTYIEYKKTAPVQEEKVNEDEQATAKSSEEQPQTEASATQAATVNNNTVSENRRSSKARQK